MDKELKNRFLTAIKKERLRDPEPSLLQIIRKVQEEIVPIEYREPYKTKVQAQWIINLWEEIEEEEKEEKIFSCEIENIKNEIKELRKELDDLVHYVNLIERKPQKNNFKIYNKPELKLTMIGYNATQEREILEAFDGAIDFKFLHAEKNFGEIGNPDYVIYSKFASHAIQNITLKDLPRERIIRIPGGINTTLNKIQEILESRR